MRFVLNRYLASVVLLAFVSYVLPANVFGGDTLKSGKGSADEAARLHRPESPFPDSTRSLRSAVPLSNGYAQPDTTEFEFPEKEEDHLFRDITVFVIVSAFVAFFLIKVFLEGDKDEPADDNGGGKPPPPI